MPVFDFDVVVGVDVDIDFSIDVGVDFSADVDIHVDGDIDVCVEVTMMLTVTVKSTVLLTLTLALTLTSMLSLTLTLALVLTLVLARGMVSIVYGAWVILAGTLGFLGASWKCPGASQGNKWVSQIRLLSQPRACPCMMFNTRVCVCRVVVGAGQGSGYETENKTNK